MTLIVLKPGNYLYEEDKKTIHISEKIAPFDTAYDVLNMRTGIEKKFEFSHSTGPEFDPSTRWVYKNKDGILLEVHNDAEMTQKASQAYLIAKTRLS